jgi:type IX secretion system PorP/SprF family membrane protein
MKKIYKIISFALTLFVSFEAIAQDINFSQFYELPMLRNPSLGGIFKGDLRVSSAYRNQWQSVTVPYQTSALGIDFKTSVSQNSSDFFSVGLQITRDVAGDSKLGKTQFLPMVTYHKLIYGPSNTYLSLGFLGGPVQQRFDPSGLRFDDQFVNGSYSITNPTRQTFYRTSVDYIDAAFGLTMILGYQASHVRRTLHS